VLSGYHRDQQIGEFVNRNTIYDRLMRQVLQGKHGGGKAPKQDDLNDDDIEILMETIALAAWYGGEGRVATVEDIRKACPLEQQAKLDKFISRTGGIFGLVAAFFFQESEILKKRGSFEFTHKSFGDYLTARRIMRQIKMIVEGQTKSAQHYSEGQALNDWYDLCNLQCLTYEVLTFLRQEMALIASASKAQISQWQNVLLALFNHNLIVGMPALNDTTLTFREANQRSQHAEEALLAALNACALATKEAVSPAWATSFTVGDLLHRLRGQEKSSKETIVTQCLDYCNFSGQVLYWQDLANAEAHKIDLSCANLSGANISGANLSGSYTLSANLSRANLSRAVLTGAILKDANLSHADLSNADLSNAYISNARLSNASISSANLSGASLTDANLSRAVLSNANLSRAVLTDANLTDANLSGASLTGANLTDANLTDANLTDANLSGTNL
jgi:uncharacterized protein YjbI with pentapeptide repeats